MATVSYRLEDLKKAIVGIGYVGENDHMHVLIDCKEVFDEYPSAVPTMVIVPPVGDSYPKAVTRNGDVVEWLVKDSDVTVEGDGEFQLTFTEGEVIRKSVNGRFRVKRSISGSGEAPSGVQDWLTDANEKLAAVEEATQEAEAAAEHQPYIGIDGYWYTWNGEEFVKNVKAQGDKGDPGDPGSPGDPTELIDDTAGEGVTDKTLSADKLAEKFGDVLSAIEGKPDIDDSDATGVDLDITDPSGNVLVRLKDGHVQTKNFDSSHMTETLYDDAENTDMDITDESGHVLARFAGGHFQTKNFDSRDVIAIENVVFPEKGTSVTVNNVADLLDEIENGTSDIIYLENGTYNLLNVEVNRKVQIIGKSRTRVLLVSDGTQDQDHDVTAKHGIRFNYGGALRNLTFSVNDVKYVIHQDEIYREYELTIENCTFKRYDDSCGYYFFIGCGCLGKQTITVNDCSFIFSPNTNARTSYGIYWHNWHLAKNALSAYTAKLVIDSCDCIGCGIVIAQDLSDKTVNDYIHILSTYSSEGTPVSSGANGTYISVTSENVPYNIVFIINCKIGNMRLQDRDSDEYDYLGAVVTNFVN